MMFSTKRLVTGDIPTIDRSAKIDTEMATLAMGCFWGPDALFGAHPGIIRTRVGYAGGKKDSPTYRSLGDHTETIQLEYDPKIIDHQEILNIFLDNHDPTYPKSIQYRSMIFYHHDHQKELALEVKDEYPNIVVKEYTVFHMAEDYHQKYHLSTNKPLYKAFRGIYPEMAQFVDSTAVARANGYAAGKGYIESEDSLKELGLNQDGRSLLYGRWRHSSGACCR